MTNFDLQFSKLICFSQLNLTSGDLLSINSEESTYSFALDLAKFATKITNLPVTIVVTEDGKVTQSVPVEPDLLDIQKPQVKTQIMCRILDLDKFIYLSDEEPDSLNKSVIDISKFGLLSEPIDLKRRIAIPWTIVAYPSKKFVEHAFGVLSENEVLAYFAKLLRFDNENMIQYWVNQSCLLNYRSNELNSIKDKTIIFKNRTSKFQATIIDGANWASNYITLKNNRSFYNFLPSQNIHTNIESDSFNGHIEASRDFILFGSLVRNATFNIKDGYVVSYNAEAGKAALDAFFNSDENSRVVSAIVLNDEESIESKYINKGTHPLFSLEHTSSIILGGAMEDSLRNFDEDTNLDNIKVNQSLVKLSIPVGDVFTSISIGELTVINEGSFII